MPAWTGIRHGGPRYGPLTSINISTTVRYPASHRPSMRRNRCRHESERWPGFAGIRTPRRVLGVAVLAVALFVAVAYGAAALWDYRKQSEQEYWEKLFHGKQRR